MSENESTEHRKYTADELKKILDAHARWRRGDKGEGSARAYLAGANLARADLAGAYLAGADLADANLAGANLARADLAGAYLAGANLAGADLAGANLAGANLAGANLAGANLARADLAGAYLAGAYLAGADLAGAYLAGANLARANLADAYLAGANLADADLAGAYLAGAYLADAYLADAKNLDPSVPRTDPPTPYVRTASSVEAAAEHARRYRERFPEIPVVEHLDARILDIVDTGKGVLDMSSWHRDDDVCGTTHCRAGWAIVLAGEAGKALERKHNPERAGAMIYRASTGRVPWFYAPNDLALEDIRRCAAESPLPGDEAATTDAGAAPKAPVE